MSTIQPEIDRLDRCYQKLTTRTFRASGVITGREYAWSQFIKVGYTVADLEDCLLWIKRGIQRGVRHEPALGFRRLIGDLMIFEDELAAARAENRNAKPAPSPKERVLEQARPTVSSVPVRDAAKPAGQVDWIKALRESVSRS